MYCTHCGQTISDGSKFCKSCGNPVTSDAVAPIPPVSTGSSGSRMRTHVKVLAWIHLIFGALGCFAGLLFFLFFSFLGRRIPIPAIHHDLVFAPIGFLGLGLVIAGFFFLFSLPAVLAGFGLLRYAPWARILALILCFLNLLNIPFGTLFGAYGLWVLLSSDGQQHYQQQAALSQGG